MLNRVVLRLAAAAVFAGGGGAYAAAQPPSAGSARIDELAVDLATYTPCTGDDQSSAIRIELLAAGLDVWDSIHALGLAEGADGLCQRARSAITAEKEALLAAPAGGVLRYPVSAAASRPAPFELTPPPQRRGY